MVKIKKLLSVICLLALLTSLMAGCGSTPAEPEQPAAPEPEAEAPVSDTPVEPSVPEEPAPPEPVEPPGPVLTDEQQHLLSLIPEGEWLTFQEYPLTEEPAELTMFYSMHPLMGQFFLSADELPIYQTAEEITGVHIEFVNASFMVASTQAQLMLASGEMTDIMPAAMYYTAGSDAAVHDDLILDLTDLLPEHSLNYQALIDNNPNFKQSVTTAEGRVVGFSLYSMDNTRIYISGPEVRKDWLDKVGLEPPETLDEYHDMLSAFKTELDVETPMWLHYSGINRTNQLTRAFDINGTQNLLIDGEITSSLLQPGFKEYLTMMNQWYNEGLVDPDFYSDTSNEEPALAQVADDGYGLFYQYASEYTELKSYATDPDFEILAITDAVKNKGDKLKISNGLTSEASDEGNYNITTSCENVELALQWMDFFYSPDGWLLSNYGTEGESFEYDEDGIPHWTDLINKSEYPGYVAKSMYTMLQGAFLMHAAREFGGYTQDMIEASDIWASVEADSDFLNVPVYVTLSGEVSETISSMQSDLSTYVEECLVKFIIGDMNLESDYDDFIATLETMNIYEILAAYQDAYDSIRVNRE